MQEVAFPEMCESGMGNDYLILPSVSIHLELKTHAFVILKIKL